MEADILKYSMVQSLPTNMMMKIYFLYSFLHYSLMVLGALADREALPLTWKT